MPQGIGERPCKDVLVKRASPMRVQTMKSIDIIDFSTGNTHKERVFWSAVEAIFHLYTKEKRDERDFET